MREFAKFAIKLFSGLAALVVLTYIFLLLCYFLASRDGTSVKAAVQRVATVLSLDVNSIAVLSKHSGTSRAAAIMQIQADDRLSDGFIPKIQEVDGASLFDVCEFLDKELALQKIDITIKDDYNIWKTYDAEGNGFIYVVRHGNVYLLFYCSMN